MAEAKVGDRIRIVEMAGEPFYDGRTGIVEQIDRIGQMFGTWGGMAVQPDVDRFEVIADEGGRKMYRVYVLENPNGKDCALFESWEDAERFAEVASSLGSCVHYCVEEVRE